MAELPRIDLACFGANKTGVSLYVNQQLSISYRKFAKR